MINLIAPINNLGYGVAGYNIFKSLYKINPSTILYPISNPTFVDEYISAGINNQSGTKGFPSVKIWHQNDLHLHVGKGKHIGFPIFELTEFTEDEKRSMACCDSLFVCSDWAKEVVLNQTSFSESRVHVVPLGVDTEIFKPHLSKRAQTIFFNCGKWEKRKGHDVLLECFNMAFNSADNVELWMMCDNPFIGQDNQSWQNLYKSSPLGDKIRIIPRQHSHKDVYNIMKQSDCGVFPSRAEGWNLELLEMMTCGKQVIATNYSAHTQFCDNSNSHLIDVENREAAYDGVFFSGSHGQWGSFSESSVNQLVEHMRMVHTTKQQYENAVSEDFLNKRGIETANRFSWSQSAQEIIRGVDYGL